MPLLVAGVNHQTTPLDMRGRLAIATEDLPHALCNLKAAVPTLEAAAILSTCNRVEIHASAHATDTKPLLAWLAAYRDVSVSELGGHMYSYTGEEAVTHAIRVAAGLDSQILGEPQIQGQFKQAYRSARESGMLNKELVLLENFALQTAKRIRTETQIGAEPVSVAYATITMARQIFSSFEETSVLLIGAGSNIRLISEYLRDAGTTQFTIANRTRGTAEQLAESLGADVIELSEINTELHRFDIVISSTAASELMVTTDMLVSATAVRRHRTMFIADLAVPRDVEASANELADIYLYTVDDLSKIISQTLDRRKALLTDAERLVSEGVHCYKQKRRLQVSSALLIRYRSEVDEIRQSSLTDAERKLAAGEDVSEVLSTLAHVLTNQLAHKPTLSIRKASASDNPDFLHLLKHVYDPEPKESP